jgi:hypothetical protein
MYANPSRFRQNLLRRRTNEALPRYESVVSMARNRPHIITVRPIRSGGANASELATRTLIATTLREKIIDEVQRSSLWTRGETIRRVEGTLTGVNMMEANRGVSKRINNLRNLTQNLIEEMFEMMVQSADELLIYQIEWAFVINPIIYDTGASGQITIPSWALKNTACWRTYSDDLGPISCASIAICLASRQPQRYTHLTCGEKKLKSDARELQTEMGWDTHVGINELERFVEKYPNYRLTCLMPAERNFLDYTFTGTDFKPVPNTTEKFTGSKPSKDYLYIYLDLDQKHYINVPAPQAFFRRKLNSAGIHFCHQCIVYFRNTQDHICETNTQLRKYKSTLCLKCGLHNCTECRLTVCKNCRATYEKKSIHSAHTHRCIVMEIEKEDKGYNTGSNDGKLPSLWIYDLESRVQKTFLPIMVSTHDLDSEGFYPDTAVEIITTNEVNQQIPNMVFAVNVFTKQELFYFGESCIHDFMTFLLNHNRGKH